MHYRYYSTKLQVFQEYLAPRRVLVLIQVGVKKENPEGIEPLERVLECGWCEQSADSYGNLLRLTSSPQESAEQCYEPIG